MGDDKGAYVAAKLGEEFTRYIHLDVTSETDGSTAGRARDGGLWPAWRAGTDVSLASDLEESLTLSGRAAMLGGLMSPPPDDGPDPIAPEHVTPLVTDLVIPASERINGEIFVVHGGLAAVLNLPSIRAVFHADTPDGMWTLPAVRDALAGEFAASSPESPGFACMEKTAGRRRSGMIRVMDYSFRQATATDLGLMWRGERAYMRSIEPEHEQRWLTATDRHLDLWTANLHHAVVAEADGQPAGYALWMPEGNQAVLVTIHVLTEHRRHGLGALLLTRFIEDARTADFKVLALSVKDNNPAIRLYERHGFQRGDDQDGYRTYAMRLK